MVSVSIQKTRRRHNKELSQVLLTGETGRTSRRKRTSNPRTEEGQKEAEVTGYKDARPHGAVSREPGGRRDRSLRGSRSR